MHPLDNLVVPDVRVSGAVCWMRWMWLQARLGFGTIAEKRVRTILELIAHGVKGYDT